LDRAVRAIGADKHIAGRDADSGEESNDPAVRANLVTLEGLTEVHDVLQPVQQVSAEGFPVDGVPLFGASLLAGYMVSSSTTTSVCNSSLRKPSHLQASPWWPGSPAHAPGRQTSAQ